MKLAKRIQLLGIVTALIGASAFAAQASSPIIVKIVDAPSVLTAGQSYDFTLEAQNTTIKPVAIPLFPGFISRMCWTTGGEESGAGGCTGTYGTSARCSTDTNYDVETGKFDCHTTCRKYDDFVILQPTEIRRFQIKVEAPGKIAGQQASATVFIELKSGFNEKETNLPVWAGKIELQHQATITQKKTRSK